MIRSSLACVTMTMITMMGCVSRTSEAPAPSARTTLAHLARFSEFADHLGQHGQLETSSLRGEVGYTLERKRPAVGWTTIGSSLDVVVSPRASGPTRIARTDDAGAWIELTADDLAPSSMQPIGGAVVALDVARATDLVQVIERDRFEEIRVLRSADAPNVIRQRVTHGPSIASLKVQGDRVEAVGHDGTVLLSSAPVFAVDDRGSRRGLHVVLGRTASPQGDEHTLVLSLDTRGLVHPIAVDPLWTAMPVLTTARYKHGAVAITGGRAMIAGGWKSTASVSELATTAAFDGTAKTWSPLANMTSSGDSFVMTPLSSGKILVTGGNFGGLPGRGGMVYDPVGNAWASGGTGSPYQADVVAPLSGDRALAVSQPTALLWTLSTSSFVAAGTATAAHSGHTATTLAADKVLVVGGTSTATDVWDPSTKTFAAGAPTSIARTEHTATLLASGRVLIAGGTGASSAEIYDPTTAKFAAAGTMSTVRTKHTATLLAGERVLVVGGQDGTGAALSTAEVYDGATNTWSTASPMASARYLHTATGLSGGRVLVVGGFDGTSTLSTVELFEAYATGVACATNSECSSGFCVDAVCCDSACAGQCEACDVAGSAGTCTIVSGAPHGTRASCEAGGSGVCARACDGKDRSKCNFAGASVTCAPASCVAGTASAATSCDGAGNCPTPKKTDCTPYACAGTACKSTCTGDGDCGGANVCDVKSSTCIPAATSKCSPDGTTEVPVDPGKPSKSCAPYACDSTKGACATRCATTADCASGFGCDSAGVCAPASGPSEDSSGGCAVAGVGTRPNDAPILLLVALCLLGTLAASRRSFRTRQAARHDSSM